MASQNGTGLKVGYTEYEEVGTPGLESYSGFISEAYSSQLNWPGVEPVYSRIWRSNPEATIARLVYGSLAGKYNITWHLPEQVGNRELPPPNDTDKRALDFAYSVTNELENGIDEWLQEALTRVPFFGWRIWEAPLGLRRQGWKSPNDDGWRSNENDGLIGFRKLASRSYSSFDCWDIDDNNGRIGGMWQQDFPNPRVLLPIDRLLHVTHGDHSNPEGLALLEAHWRIERLLYGYEVVHGIGSNHAAGYLEARFDAKPSAGDKAIVAKAARAIMSPQEGNYVVWPSGVEGEVKDTNFQAAAAIEEKIQNLRVLALTLYGCQFAAMNTMSAAGSYAALSDSSSFLLLMLNGITESVVKQADKQLGERLFRLNKESFTGMTRRPKLTVNAITKQIVLNELSAFIRDIAPVMPLGEDDYIAIRKLSEVLPEMTPEDASVKNDNSEMARRPFTLPENERPGATDPLEELVTSEDVARAVRKFEKWAEKNEPDMALLLRAKVDDGNDA